MQERAFNCVFERTPLESIQNHSISFVEYLLQIGAEKLDHRTLQELYHSFHSTYKSMDDTLPLSFLHYAIDQWLAFAAKTVDDIFCTKKTLIKYCILATSHNYIK